MLTFFVRVPISLLGLCHAVRRALFVFLHRLTPFALRWERLFQTLLRRCRSTAMCIYTAACVWRSLLFAFVPSGERHENVHSIFCLSFFGKPPLSCHRPIAECHPGAKVKERDSRPPCRKAFLRRCPAGRCVIRFILWFSVPGTQQPCAPTARFFDKFHRHPRYTYAYQHRHHFSLLHSNTAYAYSTPASSRPVPSSR